MHLGLEYDPETGAIYKDGVLVKMSRMGGAPKSKGEYYAYQGLYAHRLAFILMTGSCPRYVDHINGNKLDNRWSNLRPATMAQNKANEGLRSTNTSGWKGVSWHKKAEKWRSYIGATGEHLGLFDCPAAAHIAYVVEANRRYGEFHRGA